MIVLCLHLSGCTFAYGIFPCVILHFCKHSDENALKLVYVIQVFYTMFPIENGVHNVCSSSCTGAHRKIQIIQSKWLVMHFHLCCAFLLLWNMRYLCNIHLIYKQYTVLFKTIIDLEKETRIFKNSEYAKDMHFH